MRNLDALAKNFDVLKVERIDGVEEALNKRVFGIIPVKSLVKLINKYDGNTIKLPAKRKEVPLPAWVTKLLGQQGKVLTRNSVRGKIAAIATGGSSEIKVSKILNLIGVKRAVRVRTNDLISARNPYSLTLADNLRAKNELLANTAMSHHDIANFATKYQQQIEIDAEAATLFELEEMEREQEQENEGALENAAEETIEQTQDQEIVQAQENDGIDETPELSAENNDESLEEVSIDLEQFETEEDKLTAQALVANKDAMVTAVPKSAENDVIQKADHEILTFEDFFANVARFAEQKPQIPTIAFIDDAIYNTDGRNPLQFSWNHHSIPLSGKILNEIEADTKFLIENADKILDHGARAARMMAGEQIEGYNPINEPLTDYLYKSMNLNAKFGNIGNNKVGISIWDVKDIMATMPALEAEPQKSLTISWTSAIDLAPLPEFNSQEQINSANFVNETYITNAQIETNPNMMMTIGDAKIEETGETFETTVLCENNGILATVSEFGGFIDAFSNNPESYFQSAAEANDLMMLNIIDNVDEIAESMNRAEAVIKGSEEAEDFDPEKEPLVDYFQKSLALTQTYSRVGISWPRVDRLYNKQKEIALNSKLEVEQNPDLNVADVVAAVKEHKEEAQLEAAVPAAAEISNLVSSLQQHKEKTAIDAIVTKEVSADLVIAVKEHKEVAETPVVEKEEPIITVTAPKERIRVVVGAPSSQESVIHVELPQSEALPIAAVAAPTPSLEEQLVTVRQHAAERQAVIEQEEKAAHKTFVGLTLEQKLAVVRAQLTGKPLPEFDPTPDNTPDTTPDDDGGIKAASDDAVNVETVVKPADVNTLLVDNKEELLVANQAKVIEMHSSPKKVFQSNILSSTAALAQLPVASAKVEYKQQIS